MIVQVGAGAALRGDTLGDGALALVRVLVAVQRLRGVELALAVVLTPTICVLPNLILPFSHPNKELHKLIVTE